MFQALFLQVVGRPKGISRDKVLHRYNQQFGLPTSEQRDALFAGCRRIFAVSEWAEFYQALGLTMPTEASLCARLEDAIDRSWSKGYHGPKKGPDAIGARRLLQRDFNRIRQASASQKQEELEPRDAASRKQEKKSTGSKATKADRDTERKGAQNESKEGKEKDKKEGKEKK